MDALQYIGALRRRWPVVAGAIVIALTAGFLVNFRVSSRPIPDGGAAASEYTATALLMNTSSGTSGGIATLTNATIAILAKTGDIPQRVANRLNYDGSPLELASAVSVVASAETGLLEVTTVAEEPRDARRLTNVYAEEIVAWVQDRQVSIATTAAASVQDRIGEVRDEIAELEAELALNPPDSATLEAELAAKTQFAEGLASQYEGLISSAAAPSGLLVVMRGIPQATLSADAADVNYADELSGPGGGGIRLILAALLGLVAGTGIALLLDRVDTRIRSKHDAEEHFMAPVLAEIPYVSRRDRGPLPIAAAKPKSEAADAYRLLATSIERHDSRGSWESSLKTILVTSGGPGEGKSTVVANLAASFAEMGKRVLTVSCDFRRPRLHEFLGVANAPGLTEAIQASNGQAILPDKILPSSFHDFVGVVPSGSIPDKPGELLSSEAMKRALGEARQMADVVLLDTSPLNVGDAALLLDHVDSLVIVARAGQTHTSEASQTAALLARLRAPVRGIVLVGTETSSSRGYRSGSDDSDGLLRGFSLLARHSRTP